MDGRAQWGRLGVFLIAFRGLLPELTRLQGYFGAATGRGRQAAKAELEKLDLPNITVDEGVKHAARIIHAAHGDNSGKDKDFELEMTWVRVDAASVKGFGKHEEVPKELVEEAEKEAKKALEGDDDDEKMEES